MFSEHECVADREAMNANLEGVGEELHPACRQEGVVEVGPLLALLVEEEEAVDP